MRRDFTLFYTEYVFTDQAAAATFAKVHNAPVEKFFNRDLYRVIIPGEVVNVKKSF